MRYMKAPEMRDEPEIAFVCEQDGEPERVLKGRLFNALREFPSIESAYLARVRYADSDQSEVALCLCSELEEGVIVETCARLFREIFNHAQCLDILFLNPEQRIRMDSVGQPFFVR